MSFWRPTVRRLRASGPQQRGEQPAKSLDPYLLRDVATVLLECGLRPEECSRLRWVEVRDGTLRISHGKTSNAARVIPLTPRAAATIQMRSESRRSDEWVFPSTPEAATSSNQPSKSATVLRARPPGSKRCCSTRFRHTCLTRWAATMDPYTLAYLAGIVTSRYEALCPPSDRDGSGSDGKGPERFG